MTPSDPFGTPGDYNDLGAFLARQSPYHDVDFPDFTPGTIARDLELAGINDPSLQTLVDKHVVVIAGAFKDYNKDNLKPDTIRTDQPATLSDAMKEALAKFKFSLDGENIEITKLVRVEYRHPMPKADGTIEICNSVFYGLWGGDDH